MDITPKWSDVAPLVARGLQSREPKAHAAAMAVLEKMAAVLQYHHDQEQIGAEYPPEVSACPPRAVLDLLGVA